MRSIRQNILIFSVFAAAFASCKKMSVPVYDPAYFKSLPAKLYSASDKLANQHPSVYGRWEVYATSGGFTGAGYPADFEYLLLKPNGIFGIIRNDSLVSFGKISVNELTATEVSVSFVPDKKAHSQAIQILLDPQKYIRLTDKDSLHLEAPCCDRFNTHLKRHL